MFKLWDDTIMNKQDTFICDCCKEQFYYLTELSESENKEYNEICVYCTGEIEYE